MNAFLGFKLAYNNPHCVIYAAVKLGFLHLYCIPYPEELNYYYPQQGNTDQGNKGIKHPLIHGTKIDKEVLFSQQINVSLTKFNASLTFLHLISV